MADRARRLLDELLGPTRDLTEEEMNGFDISNCCIYHIIGICPFYALEKTKGFIKKCPKEKHKQIMKELIPKKVLKKCEKQLLQLCKNIICELEMKNKINENTSNNSSKIQEIESLLKLQRFKEADKIFKELENSVNSNQKITFCEVCAVEINTCVNSKEYKDHLSGKLHLAYQKIREILPDLLYKHERNKKVFFDPKQIKKIKKKIEEKTKK